MEVVSALLAAGADQHEANTFGELPLHAAAFTGMDAVLPVLLNALAPPQVDTRTRRGRTPLHLAGAHDRPVRVSQKSILSLVRTRGHSSCISHGPQVGCLAIFS